MLKKTIIISLVSLLTSTLALSADYMQDARDSLTQGENQAAIIQLKNQLKNNPKDAQARYLLGTTYLSTGQVDAAEKELNKAYRLNAENSQFTLAYAEILLLKREYKQVTELLNQPFSDKADEQQRQIYQAYAYLGLGQRDDAEKIFTELEQTLQDVQIYHGLALLAWEKSDIESASQWIEKALLQEPDNRKALQLKAKIANIEKKHADALTIYDELIKQYPNDLQLYIERAATLMLLGKLQDAEKDIQQVLKEAANFPKANYLLAQIKIQEGDFAAAQRAAQLVLNYVPKHTPSMLILGFINLQQSHFNQAEKYIIQYLSTNPDNINAQNMLANVYLRQGKADQALLLLETISEEVRERSPQLLTTMGSAYLLQGDHEKAIAVLTQARALSPESEIIQQRLIAGQYHSGDIDNAIFGLEAMLEHGQSSAKDNYLLIVSYLQKQQFSKAEAQLKEFIKQSPEDPQLYHFLAIVEKNKGYESRSKAAYEQALQLDENFIPAYLGLAQLSIEKQQLEQAKGYLNEVIRIDQQYAKAYILLAGIAKIENNPREIENQLLRGVENASDNVEAKITMAAALEKWYIRQKQAEKLLPLAQQLVISHPENKGALSILAAAEIASNNERNAELTLEKIINLDDTDTRHRLLLANILARQPDRKSDVITLMDAVIKLNPGNSESIIMKADYQLKIQHYQQALENYQLAYNIQADNKVLIVITEILLFQGQEDEAVKFLQEELEKDGQNLAAHFKLASIYQQSNRPDKAIEHYLTMLEIRPDNTLALNNLAWIYAQQDNPEAISMAKKAYENAPDSAAIADTYGYILLNQGKLEAAINILEEAARNTPEVLDIQYHLAKAYYLNYEEPKAKIIIDAILSKDKNFSEKENAKNLQGKLKN